MQRWIFYSLLISSHFVIAQPGTITEHLKIDQFGYPLYAEKICVINNPQAGFDYDSGDFYTPGATLQIRNASNNALVFSGPTVPWNGGTTYNQSGDKVWWFDFSSITTKGTYYVYDPATNKSSYTFKIDDEVYSNVLKQSVRMFFYQRSGFAKTEQYAYDWDDGASHLGTQQDLDCRLVTNPIPSTSKHLQGGWFDAGDYNKYVNFAYEPIHDLLFAYIERPLLWTDDYNIPESGNGIPDLLDEVKWEMDWLRRMQLQDGSVLMKVSVTDFSAASPPSADTGYRRYGPAQASATRMAASMYAIGAVAYYKSGIPSLQLYADTLKQAAINAWNWVQAHPAYSYYDNAGFVNANCEIDTSYQRSAYTGAAVLLFALTGNATYKAYVDNYYDIMHPMLWGFWYPWESIIQDLLLYYASLPGATTSVKNAIQNSFKSSMATEEHLLPAYTLKKCAYRGYLNNGDNVWGSNRPRGHNGSIFYNIIHYDLETDTIPYRNAALGYINFLHGVNPISTVMLTNMYDFGAEKSANEMYHSWFAHGTVFDNAITSLYGPPPGYQPGGFNPNYAPDPAYGGTIVPPQFQPSLKSYKDWNTSWPENSWEITETSISNQGSYVKLLSKFVPVACVRTVTSALDQGQSTLRQAIACASAGDTIFLDLPSGDTIEITSSTILINKNLTIINLNTGHAPIYSSATGAGMTVTAGTTLHIHNIFFAGQGSSLIHNQGTLHLHNIILDATGLTGLPLLNQGESRVYGIVNIKP
jgi:endoglucanase